ncbi:NIPSNAP family protein [Sphingomonas azotifigens]|uniref:NIPSNAP family protein n=1 Tax=Sphingomonas azotifigens TaxID=330920 RepID=UPI000A073999|nr:NIPSNAP family protein [Sphingomonas azotifigens]
MRLMLSALLALLPLALPAAAQTAPTEARQEPVYELRIYTPAPGKAEALSARFRNHTLKLFAKHGMRNIAYWNELPRPDAPEGRVVYILSYPSRAARDADWKAFGDDPEWQKVVAESEANGKLVTRVDSIFMTMAAYSPPLGQDR